jgi:hypothetical protein
MTQGKGAAAVFIDGDDVILSASEGSAFVFFHPPFALRV